MSTDQCFLTSEQFFLSEDVFKSMTKNALCTNCNQHVGKHRKSAIIAETPTVVAAEKKAKRKRVTIADPPEVVLNPSNDTAVAARSSKDPKETDAKPSTPASVVDDGHLSISEDEESNDENDEVDDATETTPHNPYLKKKKPRKVNNARDGKYGVGRDSNTPRRGGGRFTDGPGRGFGNRDRGGRDTAGRGGGRGEGRGRGGRGINDSSRSVSGFDQQFGQRPTPQQQHQSFPIQGSGHSFATHSGVSPFAQYSPQQMQHQQAHFMQMMTGQQLQPAPVQPQSQPDQPQIKVEAVSTVDQIVVPPPPPPTATTSSDASNISVPLAAPSTAAPVVKKHKSMQPLPGIPVVPLSEILASAATIAPPIAVATSVAPVVKVDSLTPAPIPKPTVEDRPPLVLRASVNTPTTATVSVIPMDSRSVTPEPEPRHQMVTLTASNVHNTSVHTAETNAPPAVSTGSNSVAANVQTTSAVHADATPAPVVPAPRPPPPPGPRPVYNSFGNVAIVTIGDSRAQDGSGNLLKMSVLDKVQARQLQMQQHESLAQQLMPPPTALPSAFTVHPSVSAELARQQQMQQTQQTQVVSSGVGDGVENGVPVNCSML